MHFLSIISCIINVIMVFVWSMTCDIYEYN